MAHPLANKVGWFNLNNINCGLLGMPLGFLVIYVVSLFTKAPSAEMQAFVDEIRKPRGRTVLEEKTELGTGLIRLHYERGPSGPRFLCASALGGCARSCRAAMPAAFGIVSETG